jgi:hypothetical protein
VNDPNGQRDARVQVLTAEVQTLVVGSRQVTLSVFWQLDRVDPLAVEPFGRVQPRDADRGFIWVVGRHAGTGALVRSRLAELWPTDAQAEADAFPVPDDERQHIYVPNGSGAYVERILPTAWRELRTLADEWRQLPLIVLAGLR